MFWDTMALCMILLKEEWKVNQQVGEEECKCYTIWLMMALLHSNEQARTERYGDRERMSKTCCRRLLMMMIRIIEVALTNGAIRHAKLQSNRHHQQTNTQLFTGRMPFLLPNQHCQHCVSIFMSSFIMSQKICETNSAKRDKPALLLAWNDTFLYISTLYAVPWGAVHRMVSIKLHFWALSSVAWCSAVSFYLV